MAEIKATLELKGWNAQQLALRVPAIMEHYGTVMDKELKNQITSIKWPWPNTTKRYGKFRKAKTAKQFLNVMAAQGGRTYTIAGSPRDIVDSGDFLASQRKEFNQSKSQLVFTWDARSEKGFMYAGAILTGYQATSGRNVKGRNWIKAALDVHPLDSFFIAEWRKLSSNNL
jgi:hypothetical protein